jgi:hypothetical protein
VNLQTISACVVVAVLAEAASDHTAALSLLLELAVNTQKKDDRVEKYSIGVQTSSGKQRASLDDLEG